MTKDYTLFSKLLLIIKIGLFLTILYFISQIFEMNTHIKNYKKDYTELNSVQYGLFNSTIWANKISFVIDQKIDEFNFTQTSRKEIKQYVETILDTLIVEADNAIRERNSQKSSFFGGLLNSTKQLITDSLIDLQNIRKKVPQFTDAIMNELEKPSNQHILKAVLREKLQQLTANNLVYTDMTLYTNILKKYKLKDAKVCNIFLTTRLNTISEEMHDMMIRILLLTLLLIIIVFFQGKILSSFSLILLSLSTLSLLITGVLLPMLDIEAKIETLYFTLLDKPLTFENQILFFQSKSISDLVNLLITSHEEKMIFVGILLTTFSIIFPFLKIIALYIYFYSKHLFTDGIIHFFALRSTKWSMADVMVVSIFMAYLGLDGVIDSELERLAEKSHPINIITTNGTHLEVGFFLFLGFVLSSFALSILVERSAKKTKKLKQ